MCNFKESPTSAQGYYHPFLSRFFGPLASERDFVTWPTYPLLMRVLHRRPSWECALAWAVTEDVLLFWEAPGPPGGNGNLLLAH